MNSFKLASDHFTRGVSTLLGKEVPNTLVTENYPNGTTASLVFVSELFQLFDKISEKYGETRIGEIFVKKTLDDLEGIFFRAGLRIEETEEHRNTELPLHRFIRKAALAFEEAFFHNLSYYDGLESFAVNNPHYNPAKYLRSYVDTHVWHDNSKALLALSKLVKVSNTTEFFENAMLVAKENLGSIAIASNAGSLRAGFFEHFVKAKFHDRATLDYFKKTAFYKKLEEEGTPEGIRKAHLLLQNVLFTFATFALDALSGHFSNELRLISTGNGHIRNLGRKPVNLYVANRINDLEINLNAMRVFISYDLLSNFSEKIIKRDKDAYLGTQFNIICVDIGIEIAKQLLHENTDHLLNIMFNKEKATYVG